MKDDVEVPAAVPRKRKQLEDALPQWLAIWANDENQPPSARKRAQAERDRRKALHPDVRVGVLLGQEGMTPMQTAVVNKIVVGAVPTELHVPGYLLGHLRRLQPIGLPRVEHPDPRELIRASTMVVAAPKEPEKPDHVEGVWEAVRYAKHRKVPVRVVLPNGDER